MEAVRLPNFIASTWKRLAAFLVDKLIILILFMPIVIQNFGVIFGNKVVIIEWKWFLPCFVLQFCYRLFFLKLAGGTIGKLIFGLRVINVNNQGSLSWIQAFVRVLADHFNYFVGPAFTAIAFLRLDRRGLSDLLAETQVVQSVVRPQQPERRVFVFILVFFYFSITGFMSSYRNFQRSEWDTKVIKIYPLAETPDDEL